MIGPGRKWEERRKLSASRKPELRVDQCTVTTGEKGSYYVVIEGFGIRPAITPPTITVGGVRLEEPKFALGGGRVSGRLANRPENERVVVDLGYARAEGRADLEA